jgi:ACS family tartrate transporter-like MFS transporter
MVMRNGEFVPEEVYGNCSFDASLNPVYAKVQRKVAPFLILMYFVAFLDRVNVSFASLTMNRDLGISDSLFGLGAGIFFIGYLIFAVPSNVMLSRIGARKWIGILMVLWGLLSCGMAFVVGPRSYIVVRFLIGAAEAGFFPGIILYLTFWLPGSARAAIIALFTFSIPLSNVVGAPISSYILSLGSRAGLHDWQWLFLLEGVPAVLLGAIAPLVMRSGPDDVPWLTVDEKRQLADAIRREGAELAAESIDEARRPLPVLSLSLRLGIPAMTYFLLMIGLYALGFWIPRMLSSLGVPVRQLGWMTAVPFLVGGVGMLLWGRHSDKSSNRKAHLALSFLSGAIGMTVVAFASTRLLAVAGLSLASIGILSAMPIFWAVLSQQLTRAKSAVGIAAVNSVGNIGGFIGPYAIGWLLETTHHYRIGLLVTAISLLCGALLTMIERAPKLSGTRTTR